MLQHITLELPTPEELAAKIDHAVLSPNATYQDLEKAIHELEEYRLRCLITSPTLAPRAREMTRRCIGAVIGFPHGYGSLAAKLHELEEVAAKGINEIDYVMNTQLYLNGLKEEYINEARAVAELCRNLGLNCKLIIETPILDNPTTIYSVARLLANSLNQGGTHVKFLKTSTGYAPRPTYPEDIIAIKRALSDTSSHMGIKAAGGIRTPLQAALLLSLGADIIGTSKPGQILSILRKLHEDAF